MRRVHVHISGRVQGVFFRASCVERARELGVTGSVRNAEDGAVEAEFQGSVPDVDAMIEWCRVGPERARVGSVVVREEPPTDESGFRVSD